MKTGSVLNILDVHRGVIETDVSSKSHFTGRLQDEWLIWTSWSFPPSFFFPHFPSSLWSFHFCIHLRLPLSHAFVPEFTLARPRFDPLISPYKQVRTHTHTHCMKTGYMCTQTGTHTNKGRYVKHKYHPAVRLYEQICQLITYRLFMVFVRMPLSACAQAVICVHTHTSLWVCLR